MIKSTKKRLLTTCLAAVMAVTVIPVTVFAAPIQRDATITLNANNTPPAIIPDPDNRFPMTHQRVLGDLNFHTHEIPIGIGTFNSWGATPSLQSAAGLRVQATNNFQVQVSIGNFIHTESNAQTNTGFGIALARQGDAWASWGDHTAASSGMFTGGNNLAPGAAVTVISTTGLIPGAVSLWAAEISGVLTVPAGQMRPGQAQAEMTWTVVHS